MVDAKPNSGNVHIPQAAQGLVRIPATLVSNALSLRQPSIFAICCWTASLLHLYVTPCTPRLFPRLLASPPKAPQHSPLGV